MWSKPGLGESRLRWKALVHGELQVGEQGSSTHRGGVLGTVGVHCGSLGCGFDGVLGLEGGMRGAWSTLGL